MTVVESAGIKIKMQPLTFADESTIQAGFELLTLGDESFGEQILLARFTGTYRPGHQGAPDARFIRGQLRAAELQWLPEGVILDLRSLHYIWGDDMEEVLDFRQLHKLPLAVVTGPECGPGILTLAQMHRGNDKIQRLAELPGYFEAVEPAVEYLRRKIHEIRKKNPFMFLL